MSVSAERTAIRKRIRTIMASRDLSATDLARMTGYVPVYVRGLISGAFVSDPARRKIEEALGLQIWSDLKTETGTKEQP